MNKSKGLGDSVAKVTKALRLDKVADAVAKMVGSEGCGCDERQEMLNKLFPYESTKRKFKVLREFSSGINTYEVGEIIEITKKDILHEIVISYVRDGVLEEL
jgi:hypothetical protein